MASRGVPRTHPEKQALKQHTKKLERQSVQGEGRRRDFVNEIEFNHAAASGRTDEPIPTRPNSRSAAADARRAAEKGAGVMSASGKIDPEVKVKGPRRKESGSAGAIKRMAPSATPTSRKKRSNAQIADSAPTTARRSPAPRAAEVDARLPVEPARGSKRSAASRGRVPAPGNVVSVPKGELVSAVPEKKRSGVRSTASTGGPKPPKRPARAGKGLGAAKSKGADMGVED